MSLRGGLKTKKIHHTVSHSHNSSDGIDVETTRHIFHRNRLFFDYQRNMTFSLNEDT